MFKAGFIGIIGRPNAGKSTLLNRLVGEKVAIATAKPQTTRNRITGIKNMPPPLAGQFIFIDTPGFHRPRTALGERMLEEALDTIRGVDMLVLLLDATNGIGREDTAIVEALADYGQPVILAINKTDLIAPAKLLPLLEEADKLRTFKALIPLSAVTGYGTEALNREIWDSLPEGPSLFPEELFTDQTERFLAAEMIREKVTLLTYEEVPYAVAVVVEAFKEEETRNFIRIVATINVEKESQKGIVIGKRGSRLKEIGRQARLEMEAFFAARIFLELHVRVRTDWSKNKKMMKELGYG